MSLNADEQCKGRIMFPTWSSVLLIGVIAADGPMAVNVRKEMPSAKIAAPIAAALNDDVFVVEAGDKKLAKFWFRKSIPAASTAKLEYSALTEGTLVGVVEIVTEDWTDFRKQALKPGLFTLRLGWQPKDGNHMGVAPSSEFLCLSDAAKDVKLDTLDHKPLMNLSKTALDTGHPVALLLDPVTEKSPKLPAVVHNDLMHTVLRTKLKIESADGKSLDFPFGIVVVGQTTADG